VFSGTASKLVSFPDHFLPNCFRFLVLYTVYSSGLAVLYLSDYKQLYYVMNTFNRTKQHKKNKKNSTKTAKYSLAYI